MKYIIKLQRHHNRKISLQTYMPYCRLGYMYGTFAISKQKTIKKSEKVPLGNTSQQNKTTLIEICLN